MDSLFFPNENDFKQWIKEGIREYFETSGNKTQIPQNIPEQEPFLSRKEIAGIFRISRVTLHSWMKRGLPSHKLGGRVYFLHSEVMTYVNKNRREHLNIPPGEKLTHIRTDPF